MGFSSLKVKGGKLINARVEILDNSILSVKLTGDFFLHPEEVIFDIESSLLSIKPDKEEIAATISHILSSHDAKLIGASPDDFAKVIVEASK